MNNSVVMSVLKRVGNCRNDFDRALNLWLTGRQSISESHALDIFGGDENLIAVPTDFVHRNNIRMVQRRGGSRFVERRFGIVVSSDR